MASSETFPHYSGRSINSSDYLALVRDCSRQCESLFGERLHGVVAGLSLSYLSCTRAARAFLRGCLESQAAYIRIEFRSYQDLIHTVIQLLVSQERSQFCVRTHIDRLLMLSVCGWERLLSIVASATVAFRISGCISFPRVT